MDDLGKQTLQWILNNRMDHFSKDEIVEELQNDLSKLTMMDDKSVAWKAFYTANSAGDTHLHLAVKSNETEKVALGISIAPHPSFFNMLNNDHYTALHLAVLGNQASVIKELIIAGADPYETDKHGNTPLHLAGNLGHFQCAEALTEPFLSPEKYPNIQESRLKLVLKFHNNSGNTCLHEAVINNHVKLAYRLVIVGSDVEARNTNNGNTVLHIAFINNYLDMARMLLINFKFNLDITNSADESIRQLASKCKNSAIVEDVLSCSHRNYWSGYAGGLINYF